MAQRLLGVLPGAAARDARGVAIAETIDTRQPHSRVAPRRRPRAPDLSHWHRAFSRIHAHCLARPGHGQHGTLARDGRTAVAGPSRPRAQSDQRTDLHARDPEAARRGYRIRRATDRDEVVLVSLRRRHGEAAAAIRRGDDVPYGGAELGTRGAGLVA